MGRRGRTVLRFFGLDGRDEAAGTLQWLAPYLAVLAAALAGGSWVVWRFLGLSPAACLAGAGLSLAYFFLFLARMRRAALETAEEAGGPAGPTRPGTGGVKGGGAGADTEETPFGGR